MLFLSLQYPLNSLGFGSGSEPFGGYILVIFNLSVDRKFGG